MNDERELLMIWLKMNRPIFLIRDIDAKKVFDGSLVSHIEAIFLYIVYGLLNVGVIGSDQFIFGILWEFLSCCILGEWFC